MVYALADFLFPEALISETNLGRNAHEMHTLEEGKLGEGSSTLRFHCLADMDTSFDSVTLDQLAKVFL